MDHLTWNVNSDRLALCISIPETIMLSGFFQNRSRDILFNWVINTADFMKKNLSVHVHMERIPTPNSSTVSMALERNG